MKRTVYIDFRKYYKNGEFNISLTIKYKLFDLHLYELWNNLMFFLYKLKLNTKSMRIEVIVNIDSETRKVYSFNLFDLTVVFVGYHKESKPKGKRTWTNIEVWDKYARDNRIEEPELTKNIRDLALEETKKHIVVKTWSEFKNI